MPYVSQDDMNAFVSGIKDAGHLSDSQIKSVIGAMKYYFDYKGKN